MKLVLRVIQILLLVSVVAWPIGLFMTIFLFDAPGSTSNSITIMLALALLTYPVPIIVGSNRFNKALKEGSVAMMKKSIAVGLLGPGIVLILSVSLELFCGGNLACN